MENETLSSLSQMLNGDSEMRQLAVTIFCENTQDYKDYWNLRTMFDSEAIILNKPQQEAFNTMFNQIDKETIDPWLKEVKTNRESGHTWAAKAGRRDIIEKSCIITTKEEQRKQLKKIRNER